MNNFVLNKNFFYQNKELYGEKVRIKSIAEKFGTPLFVYSRQQIRENLEKFLLAFPKPHLVAYAMKANSNQVILRIIQKAGAGVDVTSQGEIYRALKANVLPEKIVYAGIGKTQPEIEYALRSGIKMFNVESWPEMLTINKIARRLKKVAPVAWRINPQVVAKTHHYISTGTELVKFGIPYSQALEFYHRSKKLPGVKLIGIHCHIGSQITELKPFAEAAKKIAYLVKELLATGIKLDYVDMGGGLGISYWREKPPQPEDLANLYKKIFKGLPVFLIVEPGRYIVGNAGVLLTRVIYYKKTPHKNFLIVDAGMNDLIRPTLYGAYHEIMPAKLEKERITVDVVGPICETGDFLGKNRKLKILPETASGKILVVFCAGAYGWAMSSQYNSRKRAAEVLIDGEKVVLIRRRENETDLINTEIKI